MGKTETVTTAENLTIRITGEQRELLTKAIAVRMADRPWEKYSLGEYIRRAALAQAFADVKADGDGERVSKARKRLRARKPKSKTARKAMPRKSKAKA